MKNGLKKKFKEIVLLYKLWFYFNKPKFPKLKLPKYNDQFYIDGFPRSGNSYVDYFFRNFHPHLEYSHHLHTVAGIKIAIKRGIPLFILLRNPLDVIASYSIMRAYDNKGDLSDNSLLVNISNEYINYYQFVYDNLDKIYILPHTIIINIEALNNYFNKNIINIKKDYSVDELNNFHEHFVRMQSEKPSLVTSMPNDERNNKKKLVKEKILKLDSYKKANTLYLKLLSESESKQTHLPFS